VVKIQIALIQFDAVPEQIEKNLVQMEVLVERAVSSGARWVMFHEGTVCDYTPRVADLAEPIPNGLSTFRMTKLSRRLCCYVSFGLSEKYEGRYFISHVFAGPSGYFYHYRKTWLWREPGDEGYRNEWARYDPGTGPELFEIDGIEAACFLCADGDAPRCIERAAGLKPKIIFYPNNRSSLPEFDVFGKIAKVIGAPMLVTNRIGRSWVDDCKGGCVIFSATGEVLAKANRDGKEEILFYNLDL